MIKSNILYSILQWVNTDIDSIDIIIPNSWTYGLILKFKNN